MIFLFVVLQILHRYISKDDLPQKILFYTRPESPIVNEKIKLYLDIDPTTLIHRKEIEFQYDFMYSHLLVNYKQFQCNDKNCSKNSELKTDTYNGKQYKYYEVKTFVGIDKLSPAEINSDLQTNLSQGQIRLVETEDFPNVVGLGPNSDFFETLFTEYFFYDHKLNITYCNYDDKQHFRFNSKIDDADLIQSIDGFKDYYLFQGKMQIKEEAEEKSVQFSIGSEKNYYFSVNDSNYQNLMQAFCKQADKCNNFDDLNKKSFDITLNFQDVQKINRKLIIRSDQLYDLDDKGDMIWKFKKFDKKYQKLQVDIVLERLFFQKFYLLISKNFNGKFYIGMRRIVPTDFWIDNLWKYFLTMIVVCLVFLIVSNLVLKYFRKKNKKSRQKQKLIQKELKEFEDLRKLNR